MGDGAVGGSRSDAATGIHDDGTTGSDSIDALGVAEISTDGWVLPP